MALSTVSHTKHHEQAIVSHNGNSVVVTLNRPKVLNSLSLEMIKFLTPLYKEWEADPYVSNIVVKGEGKAFCAGGDIVKVYHSGREGTDYWKHFFKDEYTLNHLIGTLRTPHVSIIDGVTMGGGVGLSVHGMFRIATENTLFAMPETGIGFFPDVGGSYFLSRLPGGMGMFLGLTGYRLKGSETVTVGVATHYVESSRIEDLQKELTEVTSKNADSIKKIIDKYAKEFNDSNSEVVTERDVIDRIFSLGSVQEIMDELKNENTPFTDKILNTLEKMSPTSLLVTHRELKEGKNLSFAECFALEYKIAQGILKYNDFYEGVRALLIDKDKNPKFQPKSIKEVSDSDLNTIFTSSPLTLQLHEENIAPPTSGVPKL